MTAVALSAVLLTGAGGCVFTGAALSNPAAAGGRAVSAAIPNLTLESAVIAVEMEIENPHDEPLAVTGADYVFSVRDQMVSAERAGDVRTTVPAGGRKRLTVPVPVSFAAVRKVFPDVSPGMVIPWRAEVRVFVKRGPDSSEASAVREGDLPVPAAPEVELTGIVWGRRTPMRADGTALLRFANRNPFAVDLVSLECAVGLCDNALETGRPQPSPGLAAGGRLLLELPITARPAAFEVDGGFPPPQPAAYAVVGVAELRTPYGVLRVPVQAAGQVRFADR